MALRDVLVSFLQARNPANRKKASDQPKLRIAFATERSDLEACIEKALQPGRISLIQALSLGSLEALIERKLIDVAIIDIERDDASGDAIVSRFDALAAEFPIIILCGKREVMFNDACQAKHVVHIFTHELAGDPRFLATIRSVRSSAACNNDCGTADDSDWRALPAA